MSEARKLLEDCRQILAEIRNLVKILASMPPEEVLRRMRDLPPKEKAILASMISDGETSKQTRSAMEKTPSYIS